MVNEKCFPHTGTGTIFNQFLWEISPAEGYLRSTAIDSEGKIVQYNPAIMRDSVMITLMTFIGGTKKQVWT